MTREREAPDLDVSRETSERLEIFATLLRKWNPAINLVSRHSLTDLWERHFADSIQVFRCVEAQGHWVDLGSGGGFPGLVIAILAATECPDLTVTLVESDQRKSAFLRRVIRDTGISCQVRSERIEALEPQQADILSARALADFSRLLEFAGRHLKPGGFALFPKGATWRKEVEAARSQWKFRAKTIMSKLDTQAVILQVEGISRV
jgi:16S rRNA (guanine527-N7)-methyltransferase